MTAKTHFRNHKAIVEMDDRTYREEMQRLNLGVFAQSAFSQPVPAKTLASAMKLFDIELDTGSNFPDQFYVSIQKGPSNSSIVLLGGGYNNSSGGAYQIDEPYKDVLRKFGKLGVDLVKVDGENKSLPRQAGLWWGEPLRILGLE